MGVETERKSDYWETNSWYQKDEVKNSQYLIDY
ncbi:hypothetical protein P872_19770 [Rhodonellum psychrophilum GCM71 = DSM 17998]|uniref:Uncharacterized protein n=1 Tax=Rhodonellum psychrophilum GCM71 = DSM 17998 TaxID=1123057 RepID=U5BYD3_9BACT|nr:hypothetical protein P872_19770 [Rhodonellum psychrophilum GCM71 = DSM 17998]